MSNYEYANGAGLSVLSQKIFEHLSTDLDLKADKATTYTKTEVDNLVDTDIVTSEVENPLVIETAAAQKAKSTIVKIEPIQDLHGYDHPWPAGGGKNIIPMTIANLKAGNVSGTWSGNTYTRYGISFKILTDSDGNVTGINVSGTSTSSVLFALANITFENGVSYALNGAPSGSNFSTYFLSATLAADYGSGATFTGTGEGEDVRISVQNGVTVNAVFKPMIRLSSVSDATFAPYSNICPISGLDEVTVERTGFNLWDEEWEQGSIDDVTGINKIATSGIRGKNYIKVIPNADYYVKTIGTDYKRIWFYKYDVNKNFLGYIDNSLKDEVFTIPSDTYYLRFASQAFYGNVYNNDICINISDTNKNGIYEPYRGSEEVNIDLPTTIYGGTLNLETGELVCDYGMVDLGTLTWYMLSNHEGTFYGELPSYSVKNTYNAICSKYARASATNGSDINNATSDKVYAIAPSSITNKLNDVFIRDSAYTDAATFKTAMSGVQLCYELATPITYHLTPAQLDLLKGTNVITVNGKTIQVTYREGSLATLEEVNEVSEALVSEECTSEEGNPIVIETDAAQYAKATHLTLAPVQDLHGYDHPWPAGDGKNLFEVTATSQTVNGVTFTPNSDGSITLNGQKTADSGAIFYSLGTFTAKAGKTYTLSGTPSSGTSGTYIYNDGDWIDTSNPTKTFADDTNNRMYLRIQGNPIFNNTIFKPQIEEGSTATAYEPYSNICPITPMGHRNLLVPQSIANPFVSNGITFIVNADGSVTVNGTASSNTWLLIGTAHLTAGKKYILTGGIDAGRMMQLTDYPVVNSKGFDNGSYGLIFTAETNVVYGVRAYIASGVTVNNETLYPMLRSASDPDSTFVPYGVARIGAKVTGFNIWDEEWAVGALNPDGSIDGVTSRRTTSYIPILPNTTYYCKSPSGAYNGRIAFFDKDKNCISFNGAGVLENVKTFTSPSGAYYVRITFGGKYGTTYNHDICINISDAEKNGTYEPYKDCTASLDLPEPVYSGTLDLETGEVVADMGITTIGDMTWSYSAGGNNWFYSNTFTNKKVASGNMMSSDFNFVGVKDDEAFRPCSDGSIAEAGTNLNIKIKCSAAGTDTTAFKALFADSQIVFELATPKIYQLTPQQLALFKGINNISANAKTVQVTYRNGELATTGNIVDAVEVAKQNAIGESASYTDARLATELAPILGNFATAETSPASASHAVGEYLLYNNRLYKVLAAISAGQQLTIGTNIGQTNVAAELASQASAISALNSKTAGTFTVDSALSGYENNLIVVQYGKIIVINGYINNVTLPNSRFKLGSISGVSMPNTDVRALCTIADHAYENGSQSYVNITSGGNMYIVPVGSGTKAIYMNISYIAA